MSNPHELSTSIINELSDTTDLSLFDRKTVAYYAIASHSLPSFDAYPILTLLGETNTGKNSILWALRRAGYKPPDPLVLRGTRIPILRDFLSESRHRLAIIDEADTMIEQVDFEELIKCRSRRENSQLTINRQNGDGKYTRETRSIYGPLVLHRQTPFQSPSLSTRCVTIHTMSNMDRLYARPCTKFDRAEIEIDLERFELSDIPERIAENWCPMASAAMFLGDDVFISELVNKLASEAVETIREAQAAEPVRLVLDGALGLSFDEDGLWRNKRWRLSELSEWLWQNYGLKMNSRQVGTVLRRYGLTTVKSNGVYVASFHPYQLLKALQTANVTDDEMFDKLVSMVRSTKSTKSTEIRGAKLWGADME